ncbi:protein boule-like [Clavelina lepadiformis]|uniref:RRM domain-containing protein n=1 Tax=Clavelina lepadiformis TaxID=159417 RepID=A0ABP0F1E5_CLALP
MAMPQKTDAIPCRIFVGGIDRYTTEDELYNLFQRCGQIVTINVIRDAVGPYAFITFVEEETAKVVLSQRYSFYIRGKKLRLSSAYLSNKPRPSYRYISL